MRRGTYFFLAPTLALVLFSGGEIGKRDNSSITQGNLSAGSVLASLAPSFNAAEARRGIFRPRGGSPRGPRRDQQPQRGQDQQRDMAPRGAAAAAAAPMITSPGLLLGGLGGLAAGYMLFSQAHGQPPVNIEQMIVHGYLDPRDIPGRPSHWLVEEGELVRKNITAEALPEHSELAEYIQPMDKREDGEMLYELRIAFEDLARLKEEGELERD
ncbi:hypothetical protein HH1059_11910 [Halorhodospira halochloris]|uniref:Uncharacterized protein n=1 Tax=Halorhodospira halochloris TaxID=1052 RepID=A0A0X8X997_HALHR|nr:hypothetical protein [Halorhodospira halochloris]MCG5548843.1 hypothetical protein [Halorhodospira halochloris]BAU57885.1 hypothetical protein HH1059_11910 [Halorhodospira halochloris]